MLRAYVELPRTVHLLCVGIFINRAGTFIIPFATIYLRDKLGVSEALAPLAFGAFGLGALCGSLAGGQLADLFGRRPIMLTALLGSAAMLLVLSQVHSAAVFLAGIFVFATIAELYRPAASAMIADVTTPAQRVHAYALQYVCLNFGFAIGPAIGGLLAEYSFFWLFVGDAATSVGCAALIFFAIQDTWRRPQRSRSADDGADATVSLADALRHVAHNRTFLTLCAATFLIACLYMQAMSTFPLYLDHLGLGPASYGRIIALNGLLIVICQLPVTHLAERRPRWVALVLAALFTALGFGLKAVAFSEVTFMLTVAIWTVGEMLQAPVLQPIVADLAPERMRARYMGVFGMCFSGAHLIGAPVGGVVLAYCGGRTLWLGGAVLALGAAVLYATLRRSYVVAPTTHAVALRSADAAEAAHDD